MITRQEMSKDICSQEKTFVITQFFLELKSCHFFQKSLRLVEEDQLTRTWSSSSIIKVRLLPKGKRVIELEIFLEMYHARI